MKKVTLEQIYESMLMPIGPMSVSVEPNPDIIGCQECDEDLSEEEEVDIAKQIIKKTYNIDDLASELNTKAARRRFEDCAEEIRELAKKLVRGHPEI